VKEVLLEFYPFTIYDMIDLENLLDFKVISKNQYVDWNNQIVEKFKDKWDWIEVENNPIICREVNLGFHYPDKVSISKPICSCSKKLDYCNMDKFCYSEYDKFKMAKKESSYINPSLCTFIQLLINDKVIDTQFMSNVFLYDMDIVFAEDYEIVVEKHEKPIEDNEDYPF